MKKATKKYPNSYISGKNKLVDMSIVEKSKTAGCLQTQNHVEHIKWSFLTSDRC